MSKKTKVINFEIGDVVFLQSDLDCKNPLTVKENNEEGNTIGNNVCCSWIDKQGLSHYINVSSPMLKYGAVKTNEEVKHFDLLFSESQNVYGLKKYSSLIGSFVQGKDVSDDYDTRFTYNFKKYGKNKETIKSHLKLIAYYLGIDTIVAIPAHTAEPNQMQLIYGEVIQRVNEVLPRKYNHDKPIQSNYFESYVVDFKSIKGKKIMLLDDVITSGQTMNHFDSVFTAKGFEVVRFSIGIAEKLNPIPINQLFYMQNIT
ncbi:MAG: phosphoribosyltransferase [Cytophagales bacterium]|nr:MAG: phosphoribosyltransferase [Cytophagales bacterium]